jgi:dihydrofolate reductase
VHHSFEADAFFPIIKEEEWKLANQLQLKDEQHQYDYTKLI